MKKLENLFNHKIFIYTNVFILFVLINSIAYSLYLKWDFSKGKVNTLSESTSNVLKKLKYPLLVEAYISKDIPGQLIAQIQPIISILEDIKRVGKDKINLKIINPQSEEERSLATKRGIQGIPIEEADLHKASVRMGYFGVYLQYGDKSSTISLVEQGGIVSNFEYIFLKEVKQLIQNEKTISGIGYLKGDGTLQIRRWQTRLDQDKDNLYAFKNLIEKDLGQIKDVELNEPIPETIETLIVAGLPKLSQKEQFYLDQFLLRGGNLVLFLKGFDFTISPPNPQYLQLGISSGSRGYTIIPEELKQWNEFLNHYGLEIKERIVLEPTFAVPEVDILGQYIGRYPNPSWAFYTQETENINPEHELTRNIPYVVFPWFSDLNFDPKRQPEVKYHVLIKTTPKAILRKETSLSLKDLQFVGQKPIENEISSNSPLPVMILAQGKFRSAFKDKKLIDVPSSFLEGQLANTEGKILLIGTPYLVSDIFFRNEANVEYFKINYSFVQNVLEYLQGDTDLIAVRSKMPFIPVIQIQLPVELQKAFAWFHTLTIPILLGIYGFLRLKNRYRKRGVEQ